MNATCKVLALLIAATTAHAGEVYKTTDAQGRPIYTDKPPTLPAEKLGVKSATSDTTEVRGRVDAQIQGYAAKSTADSKAKEAAASQKAAAELADADRAKRCQDARDRNERLQNSWRLYEAGPTEGERRYLTSAEIDAARANAKLVMEEFCGQR